MFFLYCIDHRALIKSILCNVFKKGYEISSLIRFSQKLQASGKKIHVQEHQISVRTKFRKNQVKIIKVNIYQFYKRLILQFGHVCNKKKTRGI